MDEIVQVRMNNWAALIKARQESGQTVKEWCSNNDVSINAYYYWLRKLRKAAIELSVGPAGSHTEFAKVPMSTMQGSSDTPLRITRGDTVFEVTNDISDHLLLFLKEVISVC